MRACTIQPLRANLIHQAQEPGSIGLFWFAKGKATKCSGNGIRTCQLLQYLQVNSYKPVMDKVWTENVARSTQN